MALTWEEEERAIRPHPGMDPVSAWLLRQGALVAGPGGAGADTPSHVGVIDFQPDEGHVGEQIVILDTQGRGRTALTEDAVSAALAGLNLGRTPEDSVEMNAPRIFLLPLHRDSLDLLSDGTVDRVINEPPKITPWPSGDSPPRAIVGVIDHAINIFHHRFQFSAGEQSRVAYAWMQGGKFQRSGDGPDPVPFGQEWIRSEIDAALSENDGDEDALLRELDAGFTRPGLRPLALRAAHGTHILDLAAGMDPDEENGRDLPIIAVNLPPEVARETTGSVLGLFFLQAFEYILQRARTIMKDVGVPIPVFINFSFGLSGGMRSGRHFLERAIDRSIARHREDTIAKIGGDADVKVFVSAGNRNMARGHVASIDGAVLEAAWQIQPGDPSSNHVDVRIEIASQTQEPTLRLTLTQPGTEAPIAADFTPGQSHILRENGSDLGRAVLSSSETVQRAELYNLSIALAASDPGISGKPALPPGAWGLKVEVIDTKPIRMDAWILRDDTPPGYHDAGRQSYFIDAAYRDRDRTGRLLTDDPEGAESGILRAGTLNAIATSEVPTAVGGIHGVTPAGLATDAPMAAPYSATPLPHRRLTPERVDISAPSERSPLRPGILAAGTRSGSRVALNGTSVAAPQALRLAIESGSAEPGLPTPMPEDGDRSPQLGERVTIGTVEDQVLEVPRS